MTGAGGFTRIRNPETKKRLKRFREHRTAYVSLWILAVLYAVSLFSEILCNSDPLYVRFNGRTCFPVFAYYPEDLFLNNGKQTRPDYKKLRETAEFKADPGNAMIFPPLETGPYESASPSDLAAGDQVRLVFNPEIRLATVNIRDDYTVSRSSNFGALVGKDESLVPDSLITDHVELPEPVRKAVDIRFRNGEAPAVETPVVLPDGSDVIVSLNDYTPRDEAPKTVRLKFEEKEKATRTLARVTFDSKGLVKGKVPDLWEGIPPDQRAGLLEKVKARFERPVDALPMTIAGSLYRLDFEKDDIRFPYPPTFRHPFGIDEAGRDVLARILYGLRISLTFGLILVFCSMVLGIAAGAVQGYYGGVVDITGQRLIEIWSALPFLYIMILMGSVYGRSFGLLLFCYGIFNWINISYYVRAEFFRLRKQAFVEAAQLMGLSSWKIMVRHILPNAMVPVITFFPFSLVGAIGSLAALDYLGFGLPAPTPSWGELLAQAQQYRWAWWLILYPSLALFTVMLLGVFIGEGIRNAFDPRRYSRLE
jgi:microcin C transport system permease protein